MAETLRFTVEVAADKASEALKALSVAANQAGVDMRTKLLGVGDSARSAGKDLATVGTSTAKLKEEMGRSRETAMFFTRALGELGPEGRTAQMAISGIAGALLGGGGLVLALEAASVVARLYAESTEKQKKASEEAAKSAKEHADELKRLNDEAERFRLRSRGMTDAQVDLTQNAGKTKTEVDALEKKWVGLGATIDQLKAKYGELRAAQESGSLGNAAGQAERVRVQVRDLERERRALEDEIAKKKQTLAAQTGVFQAKNLDQERQAQEKKADEDAKKASAQQEKVNAAHYAQMRGNAQLALDAEKTRAEYQKQRYENEFGDDTNDAMPASQFAMMVGAGYSQGDLNRAELRRLQEEQAAQQAAVKETTAAYQRWGDIGGRAIGGLITGQKTLGQTMAEVGQIIIQSVVSSAIASITADASRAGAGAAASQAGIPGIGPILAISAMGATMAAVMGLLANLPSARGGWWDTGSYEGLMMVHKREMVLPEREAAAVRSGGGGRSTNIVIQAMDGPSVERTARNHSSAFRAALRHDARRRRG